MDTSRSIRALGPLLILFLGSLGSLRAENSIGTFSLDASAYGAPWTPFQQIQVSGHSLTSNFKEKEEDKNVKVLKKTLTNAQVHQLVRLIEKSGFFELQDTYQNPNIADGTVVRLEMEWKGRKKTVLWVNVRLQPAVNRLLDFLNQLVPKDVQLTFQ